jgi:hypothetical protein
MLMLLLLMMMMMMMMMMMKNNNNNSWRKRANEIISSDSASFSSCDVIRSIRCKENFDGHCDRGEELLGYRHLP